MPSAASRPPDRVGTSAPLRLPHGPGVVRLELADRPTARSRARFTLTDARDLAPALERTRRLLDADCDPVAVDAALSEDPVLAAADRRTTGAARPGHLDGIELAVQTVLGQQVSLAAARTAGARLVEDHGEPLALDGEHEVTHLFPTAGTIASIDPASLRMPRSRGRALTGLAAAWTPGRSGSTAAPTAPRPGPRCWHCRGSDPWTADYVAMRALGDPDVFLPTDVGVRNAAARLDIEDVHGRSETWRPWRSYALMRLWSVVLDEMTLRPAPIEGDIG